MRRAEHLRAAVRVAGAVQTANAPGGAVQPVQPDRRGAGDAAVAAQGEAAEPDGGAEGAADAADAGGTCVVPADGTRLDLQFADFSNQNAMFPTKATLPETTAVVAKASAPPRTCATHS